VALVVERDDGAGRVAVAVRITVSASSVN
jgi:hypothetical protein